MAHQQDGEPAETAAGTPRDLPDQQAGATEDEEREEEAAQSTSQEDVPDTDEAGTGRRGEPHAAGTHPEQPVPDEPAD